MSDKDKQGYLHMVATSLHMRCREKQQELKSSLAQAREEIAKLNDKLNILGGYGSIDRIQAERDRYQEALEKIVSREYMLGDCWVIAKEALSKGGGE